MKTLSLFAVLIAACSAGKLPSGIKVCKLTGPDYNGCASKSATEAIGLLANGNKALGLPKIEPMLIKSIEIHSSGTSINLNQYFNDVHLRGLSKIEFLEFKPNFQGENCELFVRTNAPELQVVGPYKADGKMLLFTLRGHGNSDIKLVNSKAVFDAKCERKVKGGKTHIALTDVKMTLDVEKISFDIENLIEGNKQLSDEVLKVMNENSLDVFRDVRGDYERSFGAIFKQVVNIVLAKVPLEELFPQ